MSESFPISGWKRLAVRSFFGGIGIAVALAIVFGVFIWYSNRPERPKPWNTEALKAQWDTMEFTTGASKDVEGYPVDFYYNVRNNTDKTYPFNGSTLTVMAVLTDGNALSKDFGHYQLGDATVDGPAFIPPSATARIAVHVSYRYPADFTAADKKDANKVNTSLNYRLKELSGFVVFDEQNRYRINLPEGWKNDPDVKEGTKAPPRDSVFPNKSKTPSRSASACGMYCDDCVCAHCCNSLNSSTINSLSTSTDSFPFGSRTIFCAARSEHT